MTTIQKTSARHSAEVLPIGTFLDHHAGIGNRFSVSPLCNSSFPSTFNASGFHKEILALAPGQEGYGVDNCIRELDFKDPDKDHKAIFHMGIFATSIERERDPSGSFTDPGKHQQFFDFQRGVVDQFFSFMIKSGVKLDEMTATFFDGGLVGSNGGRLGASGERDGHLVRQYRFAPDIGAVEALAAYIGKERLFPVRSILNIDIRPEEGALVGPRIEVAVRGFEIATIVFDYFRIENGKLAPIDYIGGYAIGIERLLAAQTQAGNLYNTGILAHARELLDALAPSREGFGSVTRSPLMRGCAQQLISSTEALLHISRASQEEIASSDNRKKQIAVLRRTTHSSASDLAIDEQGLCTFVKGFSELIRDRMPEPFNNVSHEAAAQVLGIA